MTEEKSKVILEWTVFPLAESKTKALIAILTPPLAMLVIYLLMQSWLWAGLGFLLLFSSEFPFFLKSRYTFDQQGVSMKRGGVTITRKWEQINSYYPDKNGVLLSPFAKQTWLENFRGIYLQYGKHRDQIMAVLRDKVKVAKIAQKETIKNDSEPK
ncbi:MAG: hypothetical protein A2509_03445 [Candidatus Edwardsbacteria bacterium RIFOXYD12_FULL_50_11]|uniref:Uncharacterized protein n=1 Tax=Candidatus Edwardsbacteria bacterium GWF2_54_11 TaxID=1817851 RepID=A0A1F5R7V0_9BACT|nr:MAG: hypothetical protein A2502_03360 [Candidatus Edwardsbacteria bacterium RifOxyC12_full_54_24]OGF07751.1 MAG: hypothetical protein A2273_04610 [Candidatus Edwardsbacteria bacterium RifOxyA12_full_54_48]OGF10001.1 MAG: hypothetical protein A3K15_11020 [Candidatus Edwardsbacteria bacterium GWE2_54_12]OGF10530.1 MAG: hypothetical protein A2024_09290 [Candidatus Edwardsbacteria bacterium GWF2_54_11]OGF14911.1 MAG: hypothetical protein A2509_03445 [Candidatus Edwardsbacteria bacterium RIFOXYD1